MGIHDSHFAVAIICVVCVVSVFLFSAREENYGTCERIEKLTWQKSQISFTVTSVMRDETKFAISADRRKAVNTTIHDLSRETSFRFLESVLPRFGTNDMVKIKRKVDLCRIGRKTRNASNK